MTRTFRILLALAQLLGNMIFSGIAVDESISAYCWRRGYTKRVAVIDWLMGEKDHCKTAYMNEKNGSQNAPEYHKDQ